MSGNDILSGVSHLTDDTEFYTPFPAGYVKGRTKYVVVFGTVMSGLGKGIFSSSLAKILKDKGLKVAPIKLEGYLNRDSGTLNPFRHGEVFVLDDGMECDMDLGTYERMLDQNLSRLNFSTSGQVFATVLEKERKGLYLGRDVQMIPHVTGEVKYRLRELSVASAADVIFVEIGGTVGDVENAYYIEAVREMAYEEGAENFCFVALTYVIEPQSLGEQKSKAAQINLKLLNAAGIQPHIIACRAHRPVTKKAREKLALYANVPMERVFSMHDCESIYLIPEMLHGAGIDQAVLDILHLHPLVDEQREEDARRTWSAYITRFRGAQHPVTVGIIGKYTSVRDSYASIIQALEHAGTHLNARVQLEWVDSTELTAANVADRLRHIHGVIVPGGFGFRGVDGKIECIEHVRRNGVPYLGICYGMQMAVIEYARNVLDLRHAGTTEIDRDCPDPVIDLLPEQKRLEGLGGNMRLGGFDVILTPDSMISRLAGGAERLRLRFRHRYEVNPDYIERLEAGGMIFSGKAPQHPIMQVVELPESVHPFFLATQAHPELTGRPLSPSPFFLGLVRACLIREGIEVVSLADLVPAAATTGGSRGDLTARKNFVDA
ncbi:MAG: CTP synthase [Phycisphaerae bacterium]|nr:MAG: CTP synthase [Planctomycetota bacterium]KAB2949129.1 MAG: CTP synthase [Phycisphaerae bacterium]MBE7456297.1 CTP synthase [Planctomycetia bacterium]MCK6464846.1 CTP synthase [Phycisphaerae bacterium]MCL4718416.1 CTP synthase [Phycisphaerae bacterium]